MNLGLLPCGAGFTCTFARGLAARRGGGLAGMAARQLSV